MKIVAVIPVKHISERVNGKNFISFYRSDSLLTFKIRQLINSKVFDKIYISSDSEYAEKIAKRFKIDFILRDKDYCNNIVPWSDMIYHVVNSLPEKHDVHVAWCHTTSPFFDCFIEAIGKYKKVIKEKFDGLVTVARCREFILNEHMQPVNYQWGAWHKYSQHLPNYFYITGALFIAQKKEMLFNKYVISRNPYFYETTKLQSFDIDDDFDFKVSSLILKNKGSFSNE